MASLFTDAVEREVFVNEVASRRGISPVVVEKDLWVTWTLARLHEVPGMPRLTFKGGTSLSKVHGLIDRFSEDIDLTFSRAGWGFEADRDPLRGDLSHKQRDRLVAEIGDHASELVQKVVIPGFREVCASQLGEGGWSVDGDPDPQTVVFSYPSARDGHGYLKPSVRMEFGARGEPWPTASRLVRSFVEEDFPGAAPETTSAVEALAAERTFWEKATLLHALHHRSLVRSDIDALRQSRHAYDLHRMWTPIKDALLGGPELLDAVVRNKMIFFRHPPSKYELVLSRTLNATPHPDLERKLRTDFTAMGEMFFPGSPVPTFEELMETLREIDAAVSAWKIA